MKWCDTSIFCKSCSLTETTYIFICARCTPTWVTVSTCTPPTSSPRWTPPISLRCTCSAPRREQLTVGSWSMTTTRWHSTVTRELATEPEVILLSSSWLATITSGFSSMRIRPCLTTSLRFLDTSSLRIERSWYKSDRMTEKTVWVYLFSHLFSQLVIYFLLVCLFACLPVFKK